MSNPLIFVDLEYNPPRLRFPGRRVQPWKWVARSGGNHKVLAVSSEAYTNKSDCVAAVELLFGDLSIVYLREAEKSNRELRLGKPW